MHRYKILIEYCGTGLAGWQRQEDSPSIQEIIENAIQSFSGEKVIVHGAGRTDAGVHATGQIAHFDLEKFTEPRKVVTALNHFMRKQQVGIKSCEEVGPEFHARFSATMRHYVYKILNRKEVTILERDRVWWIRDELDVVSMTAAASYLVGQHDFTSFRATSCQSKSPFKTLSKIDIIKSGELIEFYFSAPSFLHHMVRNIVGSLVLVGSKKWQVTDLLDALIAKDRRAAGPTAPAQGLYFTNIDYSL